MSIYTLDRRLDSFQDSVRKLSSQISAAGVDPSKSAELYSRISVIANNSKGVIISGKEFSEKVKNFDQYN